jgi:predicted membrane-bound mannosyltransferase
VDATVMWGFILIGAGALVAGIVGIALPSSERLGAFLTLVIGAGVGVAALAVGTRNVSSQSNGETAFLVASALGFIAVVASAGILWMRASRSTPSSDQAA